MGGLTQEKSNELNGCQYLDRASLLSRVEPMQDFDFLSALGALNGGALKQTEN